MRKLPAIMLSIAAGLTVLLMVIDLHIAQTNDQVESSQTVASGKSGTASLGPTLRVYLAGDLALADDTKEQLAKAIRERELPFDEVLFVDELPPDAHEDPFLAIRFDQDSGFWTPFYAARHVETTLIYLQGRPINPDDILVPQPPGQSVTLTDCRGECSEGRRWVTLKASAGGLVSLPYIRAHAAGNVAEHAATLVADGLPKNFNPKNWSSRAHDLAHEKLGAQKSGAFSTFQRQAGCRGGIVMAGNDSTKAEWHIMYYDATRDAITEELSRSDVEARFPSTRLFDQPGLASSEKGVSVYLGGNNYVTVPPGVCGFAGWQVTSQ